MNIVNMVYFIKKNLQEYYLLFHSEIIFLSHLYDMAKYLYHQIQTHQIALHKPKYFETLSIQLSFLILLLNQHLSLYMNYKLVSQKLSTILIKFKHIIRITSRIKFLFNSHNVLSSNFPLFEDFIQSWIIEV